MTLPPGTKEPEAQSVAMLQDWLREAIDAFHDNVREVSNGEVMMACMLMMVQAGMHAVKEGQRTREQLSDDIMQAGREAVASYMEIPEQRMN